MIVTNSLTGGGAERSMNLVSNELSRRGWPIALVPINSSGPDYVIPVCEIFPLYREWQGSILNTIVAIVKFNRLVRRWNPDVIVLNCDLPELFGVFLFSKRRLVAVEHINRPWITRILFGRIVRELLRIRKVTWVAVSSHLTIWPHRQIPKAILLNPIQTSRRPAAAKFNSSSASTLKRLIFIGRLTPQKRPDWLLEMGAGMTLPLVFIGEGSMRNSLQEKARIGTIAVELKGQIRDPWSYVKKGDLLIVPSEYEGDGLVVIEGLQKSLPMLVADIPDFRRFAFPERNYCKDVADFIERIHTFGEDLTDLVIPSEISEEILASRTLLAVGDSWENFLNSI